MFSGGKLKFDGVFLLNHFQRETGFLPKGSLWNHILHIKKAGMNPTNKKPQVISAIIA
jgi:hypothetical protein